MRKFAVSAVLAFLFAIPMAMAQSRAVYDFKLTPTSSEKSDQAPFCYAAYVYDFVQGNAAITQNLGILAVPLMCGNDWAYADAFGSFGSAVQERQGETLKFFLVQKNADFSPGILADAKGGEEVFAASYRSVGFTFRNTRVAATTNGPMATQRKVIGPASAAQTTVLCGLATISGCVDVSTVRGDGYLLIDGEWNDMHPGAAVINATGQIVGIFLGSGNGSSLVIAKKQIVDQLRSVGLLN